MHFQTRATGPYGTLEPVNLDSVLIFPATKSSKKKFIFFKPCAVGGSNTKIIKKNALNLIKIKIKTL
jgi:hypothetical protein